MFEEFIKSIQIFIVIRIYCLYSHGLKFFQSFFISIVYFIDIECSIAYRADSIRTYILKFLLIVLRFPS